MRLVQAFLSSLSSRSLVEILTLRHVLISNELSNGTYEAGLVM